MFTLAVDVCSCLRRFLHYYCLFVTLLVCVFVVFVYAFLLLLLFSPCFVFVPILLCDIYICIYSLCLFVYCSVCALWFVCVVCLFYNVLRYCFVGLRFLFSPAVFVHVVVLDWLVFVFHVWGTSL